MNTLDPIAIHIIADFFGCDPGDLECAQRGAGILEATVKASGLHALQIKTHQFEPAGYTAIAMLTESHITLHTWPELGSVLLDIFTCAAESQAQDAYQALESAFRPQRHEKRTLRRGAHQPK